MFADDALILVAMLWGVFLCDCHDMSSVLRDSLLKDIMRFRGNIKGSYQTAHETTTISSSSNAWDFYSRSRDMQDNERLEERREKMLTGQLDGKKNAPSHHPLFG